MARDLGGLDRAPPTTRSVASCGGGRPRWPSCGALDEHLEADDGPRWSVLSAAGDLAAPPTRALRVPAGERIATRVVPVTGHSVSLLHERMVEVTRHVACVAA